MKINQVVNSNGSKPTDKHIVPRATAEQITRAVGVTKKERLRVRRVLRGLGYLPSSPA